MYTQKDSELILQRFACAETAWLLSDEGRRLRAKSLRHVRKLEGRRAAKEMNDMIYVYIAVPT